MVSGFATDETARGFGYQFLSSTVLTLGGFVFYMYVVHFYPTEIVGLVALLSALSNLVSIVFSLNLGTGIQHYLSFYIGSGDHSSIRELIRKFSIIAVLLSIVGFLFLWFLAPTLDALFFHNTIYIEYIRLLSFGTVAFVSNNILNNILLGLQRFRANGLIGIFSSVFTYSLIILMLALLHSPILVVIGWIIGWSTTTCILLAYILIRLRTMTASPEKSFKASPLFFYSIPLLISSVVAFGATYIDRFVVSFFLNLSQLGIYNFCLLIVSAFMLLTGPFTAVLFPKLSEVFGQKDYGKLREYASKSASLLMVIYLPLALIVAAISRSVLLFLAGPSYLAAWIPLTLILAVNSAFVSFTIIGVSLQAIRKTKIFLFSSSLSLLSNFIFSILLIPKFGIIGAAVGFSSLYIVRFSILYYFGRRYGAFGFERVRTSKTLLSAFVMFTVLFAFQTVFGYSPLRMFAYIILGLILYSLLLRTLKTFTEEDLVLFSSLFPRSFNLKRLVRVILLR